MVVMMVIVIIIVMAMMIVMISSVDGLSGAGGRVHSVHIQWAQLHSNNIHTQEIRLWVARQGQQQEERESSWEQPGASYKAATLGSGCEVSL